MNDLARRPSALDDFEFDRNGFLVIRDALSADDVAAINGAFDRFPPLETGVWRAIAPRR